MTQGASPPLRIAFVLNALATGGAEIHTVDLARSLVDLGHACRLFPLLAHEQIDRRGLEVEPVGGNALLDLAAMRRLGASLEAFDADVVVAVNGRPAAYAQLAHLVGRARRRPVVTIYHTTRLLDLRQRLQYAANLPFMNRSDALVFVSANQRDHCTRRGMRARRMLTIHNNIDGQRFNPAARALHRETTRARLGIGADEIVIGLSAAFRPEKNHLQALDALHALRARQIPARLLLLGDGPCRPQIEEAARARGLEGAVVYAGRQSDVVPWLAAFDIGILTSTAIETFSLAALEIMALGIPAVLSDIGGASEMVVPERTGYLFPVGDTDALVMALTRLADAGIRQPMGDAAAAFVGGHFAQGSMVGAYIRLFSELRASC